MRLITLVLWCQVIFGLVLCGQADIPDCSFHDTVDLTFSQKFENGSYLYEGVLIPAKLVGSYDYIEIGNDRERHGNHVRGCVCKVKRCVQFCCPWGSRKVSGEAACQAAEDHELEIDPFLNITDSEGKENQLHVREDFVFQAHMPCAQGFVLIFEDQLEEYYIYENGSLYSVADNTLYTKDKYCMHFGSVTNNNLSTITMVPMICEESNPEIKTNNILMGLSIVGCILTIIVNILVPELLKLLGKCLTSHLIALSIAFGLLIYTGSHMQMMIEKCVAFGITTYFFVMASFLWLSVIGFDLYITLRSTNFSHRYTQNRKFLFYSLYAWISALLLTGIFALAQFTVTGPLAPRVERYCFVESDTWTAMLYLHTPLLIVIVANTVFFTLTSYHIWQVQNGPNAVNAASAKREQADRDLKQPMVANSANPQPSAKEMQKRRQKEQFALFLRMFLLMGILWLFEVISYMLPNESLAKKILRFTDWLNAGKGILIFFLFICRKKVLEQAKNRILCKEIPAAELESIYEFSLQDFGSTTKQQSGDEN